MKTTVFYDVDIECNKSEIPDDITQDSALAILAFEEMEDGGGTEVDSTAYELDSFRALEDSE